jgi:membrane peptidoglycan carboxypeptidase
MMGALGHLEAGEVDVAVATGLGLQIKPLPPPQHPFFLEYIKKLLLEHPALGETREERANVMFGGGLTIQTTLDPVLQDHAHAAIAEYLDDPVADPLAGIVSMQPGTGRIVAMAGGPKTFGDCAPGEDPCTRTKVNALVPGLGSSGRQVGSSFKPIVLAAALDAGILTSWHTSTHSGQTIEECGAPGQPWKPVNYGGGGGGTLDMVNAIRRSSNVYHAKLTAEIGPQTVVDMAGRLGIRTPLEPFCSLGLGAQDLFPLDMATAFATFAAEGVRCMPLAITEVRDRVGEVVIRNDPQCEEVLDPEIARQISTMLQNVVTSGTGTGARIGRPVAGKTGTTNDWRDAWFVGYTPQLATAAWMGYEHPQPMRGILGYRTITGGSVPASMWATFMSAALEGVEVLPLPDERLRRWVPPPPPPPGPPPLPPGGEPQPPKPPPPPPDDGGGGDEGSGDETDD